MQLFVYVIIIIMLKKTDKSEINSYLEDSSNLKGGFAEGIFLPENEHEISEILKESSSKSIPLTISGGNTGTTGGCIPFGGWILGTEKLNKIINIDKKKMIATAETGVMLETLYNETKKFGLLYPPDPTEWTAFLGGTVATNASGSRSFKFGATRNWINRIKVILASGKVLNVKRGEYKANKNLLKFNKHIFGIPNYKMPNVKSSAGYFSSPDMDLIDLFIGSEGTLGVITEIEVALIPEFKDTFDIISFFENEKDAVSFVYNAKKSEETLTLEYFDFNSLELLRGSYNNIPKNAGAAVYLEVEITEKNEQNHLDFWADKLQSSNSDIETSWLGMNDKQKEDLRKFRHSMPEHINEEFKKHNTIKFASDIAVPDDKFDEMLAFYNSTLNKYNNELLWVKFGHIGQNHLHVNLVPKKEEYIPLAKNIIMEFVRKAIKLKGTCSAEHGIGKIKHDYLREMYGDKGISEMEIIKKFFDPNCILNKGNIISCH